ncbi:MAG TPA: GWxTD domain-containing protein [Candidatus Sulfotelmatobacter sp.]|nr:GWxTD domain-containing protein [Candidatus Sulfotelmatobacter sp.]
MSRFWLWHILLCGLILPSSSVFISAAQTGRNRKPKPIQLPVPDDPKAPLPYNRSYQRWLDEDVVYIVTEEERADFAKLASDQQRDKFIEDFWQRRNPNTTPEANPFEEEHYRRLAYANEHFAASIPGWKTDRGRIYIIYGSPDQVDQHFSDAGSNKASDLVGAGAIPYDWEFWHYRYIEGIEKDVTLKFVDVCACGRYVVAVTKEDLNRYKAK